MAAAEFWDADFTVPPDLYTPTDLAPLVDHPDLQVDNAREEDYPYILKSMTILGRAALVRGDADAYRGWMRRVATFADAVQLQDVEEPTQYYRDVNQLLFAGATHGDVKAFEQLQRALQGIEGGDALLAITEQCARQNISPFSWIEQATNDVDTQADAWGQYIQIRTFHLQEAGQPANAETLSTPGIDRFLASALSNQLSAYKLVNWGWEAYQLCKDPFEKDTFITRYEAAVCQLLLLEPLEADDLKEQMLSFVARINNDPDVFRDAKTTLTARVNTGLSEVLEPSTEPTIAFELSAAIENGENLLELYERIETAAMRNKHKQRQDLTRDSLTRSAAELLATRGEFAMSAVMGSRITNVAQWRNATEHYIRSGGDIGHLRHADAMRQLYNDVPVSNSKTPAWETRRHVLNFLEAVSSETPNIAQAETAILAMAEALGKNNQDCPASFMFNAHVARLLATNPASVAIGQQIDAHLRTSRTANREKVQELFTAYGSQEVAQARWSQLDAGHGAAHYLLQYASMALAAAGVAEQ